MDFYGIYIRTITKRIMGVGGSATILFSYSMPLLVLECFIGWQYHGFWAGLPLGLGIFAYGVAYFFVHDIFIHQRFKLFRNANNWYARGNTKGP